MATRSDIVFRTIDDSNFDDSSVLNRWKWDWVNKEVDGERVGEFLRKLTQTGRAYCCLCRQELAYGNRGVTALTDHIKGHVHSENLKSRTNNTTLQGMIHIVIGWISGISAV